MAMFQRSKTGSLGKTPSEAGGKKKMEVKPDSSLPSSGIPSSQPSVSLSSQNDSGKLLSPSPKYKDDNFFSFDGERDEVWGPNFTKSLRKTSQVFEAIPFIPDSSVEKIGGAFVDEERSLKPFRRAAAFDDADSPTNTFSPSSPSNALSKTAMNDYDRIKELERRIEDLEIARWKAPPVQDTIRRLLLGKSCTLSWYKSIEDKKHLLDEAINTLDGNCIMAVILFIKKTVDESIMLNILERYPVASQHYANFLKRLKDWRGLKALYTRLKDNDNEGYLALQECNAKGLAKDERLRRIRSCYLVFKGLDLRHQEDIQHVEEYSRLINMQVKIEEAAGRGSEVVQRENSLLFSPLTTTLLYCCKHYRGHERATGNPEELKKLFNISERQYFQMELLALALHRDWKGIGTMLTSKGVLGLGKKKKSPIGFERVVRLLGHEKYRTPSDVLERYLHEIDDLEVRYDLAMDITMYDVALECLKLMKDRERVRGFINHIPPVKHYEYRGKIEKLLANSQMKWKN